MWKTHLARLTGFHCLAPDFPGFGKSNSLEWGSIPDTADQVIEIIRSRTKEQRADIVGLSLGGSVALAVLSKAPESIGHAIIDGAGVLPLPGLPLMKIGFRVLQPFLHTDFVIRMIARSTKIADKDYAGFRASMMAMSPASFTRSFLEANGMRQPPGLDKVACPVLFVAGEKEPNAVRRSQAMLADTIPNAEARIAPEMGHGWLAEAVDLHVSMIQAWLTNEPLPSELVPASIE